MLSNILSKEMSKNIIITAFKTSSKLERQLNKRDNRDSGNCLKKRGHTNLLVVTVQVPIQPKLAGLV